jgi:hypothetical protein
MLLMAFETSAIISKYHRKNRCVNIISPPSTVGPTTVSFPISGSRPILELPHRDIDPAEE